MYKETIENIKNCTNFAVSFPLNTLIIWLAPQVGKMNQIVRCDWIAQRARWSYLARSGLPAMSSMKNFPKSQILNHLLTKLLPSPWLDIGVFL